MPRRPAVVFYVSGHGFGHASREIEVINTLGALRPDLAIVIRTAVAPSLLTRTLRVPVTRLDGPCDTGVVQRDSVTHDDEATMREAVTFYQTMRARTEAESERLAAFDVRVVVGDIPPLAFDVAAQLGVPSIAIGNFTWDWIYEWYPNALREAPHLIEDIRRCYRRATRALELPLSGGFEVFSSVTPLPFIARHSTRPPTETRRRLGIAPERRLALLSFGGYGLQRLELSRLDCLTDWTVMLTDRITEPGGQSDHVRFLSEESFSGDLRYEDLVAAADVVVTKPGYGIISECVAHGIAMLYTSRGHFREYDRLVEEMPSLLRCRFISQDDLFAGRWNDALTTLMEQPPAPRSVGTDGASHAAAVIQSVVDTYSGRGSRSSDD